MPTEKLEQNSFSESCAYLVVHTAGIFRRMESLLPSFRTSISAHEVIFCLPFLSSIQIYYFCLSSLLSSIRSMNASKDFVRSSWVLCSVGGSLWVEALECILVAGTATGGRGTLQSPLVGDDSKYITVHVKLYGRSSLCPCQNRDWCAIPSSSTSWPNEGFLKNIALDCCGYINTATRLYSYSVTRSYNSDYDFCHTHAELCIAWKLSQVSSNNKTAV